MSQWDKLIKNILEMSAEIRFEELRKVLEYYGYTMNNPRKGSSHFTFRKPGANPITIPRKQPIKKIHVKLVKEIIERELENEKDN